MLTINGMENRVQVHGLYYIHNTSHMEFYKSQIWQQGTALSNILDCPANCSTKIPNMAD